MKDIVANLLKEWGVKMVLKEMISFLKKSNDKSLLKLADDLKVALDNYENREQAKIG
ncbi:MAG TPA: hypothetical protein VM577_19045 [Anaerovoracaceae bacterium]|nr:hypothetical protein [Anaerovoracaceae bacterium]